MRFLRTVYHDIRGLVNHIDLDSLGVVPSSERPAIRLGYEGTNAHMKYFTADLHLCHPFIAGMRGFMAPLHRNATDAELQDIIRMCKTDYRDVNELIHYRKHDTIIINNINNTVEPSDELYVLGDISAGDRESMDTALELLSHLRIPRSRRHLIIGEHDGLGHMTRPQAVRLLDVFADMTVNGSTVVTGTLDKGDDTVETVNRTVLLSHFGYRQDSLNQDSLNETHPDSIMTKYAKDTLVQGYYMTLLHGHTHSSIPFEYNDPGELNVGVDAWGLKPVSEQDITTVLAKANSLYIMERLDEEFTADYTTITGRE